MLIIDVSQSMRATDVLPSRLAAAAAAGKQFGDELTPGINLGLIEFGGSAIVLVSPTTNPDAPKGAFTAARTAKDQGVPISTISFGTPYGHVELDGEDLAVPVADDTLKKVAELSGGTLYNAANVDQLKDVCATLQAQFGCETIRGDASTAWFRLAAIVLAASALAALLINRRLPA
jgi:hypothetical protein